MSETRQVQARDLRVGDVLSPAGTQRQRITAIRPVMTTQAGRPRRLPPVQVTVESEHVETHALYSDTVYLDSWLRVEE